MVSIVASSIWFFAIFVSATFVQCTGLLDENAMFTTFEADESLARNVRAADSYYLPFGGTPTHLLDESEGFLAGEDTPVWLAKRNRNEDPVTYKKLPKGTVKEAIAFWVHERSVFHKRINSGRQYNASDFLYPSVLAVLDYDGTYPTDKKLQDRWVKEAIYYTLGFWHSVDLQLRYISYPGVRLRLAGIVLSQSKKATPYIYDNLIDGEFLNSEDALLPMMVYWKRIARENSDFNVNAYDTIATMTGTKRHFIADFTRSPSGAADTRTPCSKDWKGINGILVHDNLHFGGVQVATHLMARTLGAKLNGTCPLLPGDIMEVTAGERQEIMGRKWSSCTLHEIATHLIEYGSCMKTPKEYHKPGKPVRPVLPGKTIPMLELCHDLVEDEPKDCFDDMKEDPCGQLLCAAKTVIRESPCSKEGQFIPDGSTCDAGFYTGGRKICLDGQCVDDPTRK